MDRAWLGAIRVALILIVGIATLVSGWKARRARHQKTIAKDYILLFVSGLILTTTVLGMVLWTALRGIDFRTNGGRYLVMFVVLLFGGALTYFSNRSLGRGGRQK